MKKLFFILIVMVAISTKGQTVINRTIYNVDAFVKLSCNEIGISDSIKIHIIPMPLKQDKPAVTVWSPSTPNVFEIYIFEDNFTSFIKMLSHELVHVRQIANCEIVFSEEYTYNWHYAKNLNYDRKFEDEANEVGKVLVIKYGNRRF